MPKNILDLLNKFSCFVQGTRIVFTSSNIYGSKKLPNMTDLKKPNLTSVRDKKDLATKSKNAQITRLNSFKNLNFSTQYYFQVRTKLKKQLFRKLNKKVTA